MGIEEAFRILGLPLDASEEAIHDAYRALTQITHPDRPGGDSENQRALNEARERAVAYSKIRHAVIPINSQLLEGHLHHALATYAGHSADEKALAIHRRRARPLNSLKWTAWAMGSASGILAVLQKTIPQIFEPSSEAARLFAAQPTITLAFVCGLGGLLCQLIVTRDRHRIDSFLEEISEKKECARELAQLLGYKDVGTMRETDLRPRPAITAPPNWSMVRHTLLLHTLFTSDLRPVLVAKSIQLGLLTAQTEEMITPETVQSYKVHFRPSLFAPPLPKALTAADHRSELVFAATLLVVFGALATYLALFQSSFWSILPALISLAGVGGAVESFGSLRRMRQQEDNAE